MLTIGIDIGGTTAAAGLVDEAGRILQKETLPTRAAQGPRAVLARVGDAVERLLARSGPQPCGAIGVGCAGLIDPARGEVVFSSNMDWRHVPLAALLRERFSLPVFADNDAFCAALGEYTAGAGRGADPLLMLTVGTGIGGALIAGGRIWRGAHGAAGIFGHMVLERGGPPCPCGRRGCFELYASTSALLRAARQAAQAHPDSLLVRAAPLDGIAFFDALRQGDAAAAAVFDAHAGALATGLADLVNILDPQRIVLGGGVSGAGEAFLGPVRARLAALLRDEGLVMPELCTALLGGDAGIVGAAALPRRAGAG